MKKELKLETIVKIDDGRIAEAWNQALSRVVLDCKDRPGCPDARKVILQMDVVPIIAEDGDLDTVTGNFQIKDSLPVRKSRQYEFDPKRNGMLAFNDLSEDNVAQRTLDELNEDFMRKEGE
jgi:hypothetical protein